MIIRIATEGQYDLDEADVEELNRLDNAAVAACEGGDGAGFHEVYAELLAFVRAHGRTVATDAIEVSDVILPPPDMTFEEAREEFSGEGLLPG
jgi:hypothetical protein